MVELVRKALQEHGGQISIKELYQYAFAQRKTPANIDPEAKKEYQHKIRGAVNQLVRKGEIQRIDKGKYSVVS
jgi:hypothetical protein